ncbi:nicotinate-nucleotide adenylyltransferase [Bacillus solitudinis]|uniref:nicotinate-nucleotide adenylyltransferase n=1 Tax=Bacillus solitudinis TaxID=2014074 RepID=UPI000C239C02|nr:nicotinate-nucleotide adenylyltransferase [Bacillus solitudinis]
MRRIGLFGGTFDPPHVGHMLIAQEAKIHFKLDEIWFIPVQIPPHKERDLLTSSEERLEMLRLATRDNPYFHVSTVEVEREGKSYTIDTVKRLKKQFPDDKFFFLIGGDMIDYLPKWEKIEELLSIVTFIGVKRPGSASSSIYSSKIKELEMPQVDFSSTMIRERVKRGLPVRYMVPRTIESFIGERGLYGEEQGIRDR